MTTLTRQQLSIPTFQYAACSIDIAEYNAENYIDPSTAIDDAQKHYIELSNYRGKDHHVLVNSSFNGTITTPKVVSSVQGGCVEFGEFSASGASEGSLTLTTDLTIGLIEMMYGTSAIKRLATTANASQIRNAVGTSLVEATTGITATATVADPLNIKDAEFVIKAKTATTIDIYVNGKQDPIFTDITVVASTAIPLTGYGIEITGGSGVISLSVGDEARFHTEKSKKMSLGFNFKPNDKAYHIIMWEAEKPTDKQKNIIALRKCVLAGELNFANFVRGEINAKEMTFNILSPANDSAYYHSVQQRQ